VRWHVLVVTPHAAVFDVEPEHEPKDGTTRRKDLQLSTGVATRVLKRVESEVGLKALVGAWKKARPVQDEESRCGVKDKHEPTKEQAHDGPR
jgi:hypothetical protein